jgi:hypothetical protein
MNSSWCGWRASSVLIRETDLGAGPDGLTPVETLAAVSKQARLGRRAASLFPQYFDAAVKCRKACAAQ